MKPSQAQIELALRNVVDDYLAGEEFDADIMQRCRQAVTNVMRDSVAHIGEIEVILSREYDPEIDGDSGPTALRAQEGDFR